jgi:hypothetical protein
MATDLLIKPLTMDDIRGASSGEGVAELAAAATIFGTLDSRGLWVRLSTGFHFDCFEVFVGLSAGAVLVGPHPSLVTV